MPLLCDQENVCSKNWTKIHNSIDIIQKHLITPEMKKSYNLSNSVVCLRPDMSSGVSTVTYNRHVLRTTYEIIILRASIQDTAKSFSTYAGIKPVPYLIVSCQPFFGPIAGKVISIRTTWLRTVFSHSSEQKIIFSCSVTRG